MSTEYSGWLELAKTLGIEGNELRGFIKEKEAEKREERLQERNERIRLAELANEDKKREAEQRRLDNEREVEQRRLDNEVEQKRFDREAKERCLAIEAEKKRIEDLAEQRKLESEERKRQEENEIKKLELQHLNDVKMKELEIRKVIEERSSSGDGVFTANSGNTTNDSSRYVKIPMFKPEVDNLDGFLLRFERICESYNVKTDMWALTLARSLDGRALEVYQRMNADDAKDYKKLKDELLKRFKLDERGYRKLFKAARREADETVLQFVERMKRYLTQWREMSGVEETYEGMLALILKDQFLLTCDNETRIYLKQQGPLKLEELIEKTQHYMDSKEIDERRNAGDVKMKSKEERPFVKKQKAFQDWKHPTTMGQHKNFHGYSGGHHFKNGWNFQKGKDTRDGGYEKNRGYSSNGNKNSNWRQGNASHKPQTLAMIESEENGEVILSYCHAQIEGKEEGYEMEGIINDEMYVNGRRVQSLLDTGASCNAVRKGLERPEQYTRKKVKCRFANGMMEIYPIAKVNLKGAGIDTVVEAVVVPNLTKPLIMGRSLCQLKMKCQKSFSKPREELRSIMTQTEQEEMKNELMGFEVKTQSKEDIETKTTCECDNEKKESSEDEEVIRVKKKKKEEYVHWSWLKPSEYEIKSDVEQNIECGDNTELVEEPMLETIAACETRSQARNTEKEKMTKAIKWKEVPYITETPEEIKRLQRDDETLKSYWEKAEGKIIDGKKEKYSGNPLFLVKNGMLYKKHKEVMKDKMSTCLLVPKLLRNKVMKVAHEAILSAHQGIRKTQDKVCSMFYWPGVMSDVMRFVKSCSICQSALGKQGVSKAPLGHLPIIEEPFAMICVDIVGPIQPRTTEGNKYILTVIDMATRYPEAIPMKSITTEEVVDKLFDIYCRTGIPKRIHTDRGGQFTSELLNEVNRLLMIRHTMSTPYHAQGNSVVERLNGTLKTTLKKLASEKPKEWDRYVSPLMFALRDSVHEGHGFTPFELMFGRSVRGPMRILKELWTNENIQEETKDVYSYMIGLQERIQETCTVAQQEVAKMQKKNEKYYNRKARYRKFEIGDKILLMIPVKTDKMKLKWSGPYEVKERVGEYDYRIEMEEGKIRIYHINLMKKYYERENEECGEEEEEMLSAIVTVVNDGDNGMEDDELLMLYNGETRGSYKDVLVNPKLDKEKQGELMKLLEEFGDIFSDVPGKTHLVEHEIRLTSNVPVKSKAYPTPYGLQKEIDQEIEMMLQSGIIERSESAYAAPLVVVKKADGTNRLCCNYKQLNQITVFDPEPMMNNEDIFNKLNGSRIFSKFDFCKGYWQIPMAEEAKDLTTFVCAKGLFRFRTMPFGLVNSASSYNRMMRRLLEGLKDLESYVDDVLAHTKNWKEHIIALRRFFQRVREANLTLKPKKCQIGYNEIDFLGHTIMNEKIRPKEESIDKIIDMPRPNTKKQVRSFLGAVNYYRRFIPDCASLMKPLTELTKKNAKMKVQWNEELETSFNALKKAISCKPILKLPDVEREFTIRTDASDHAVGCVLLQEHEGIMHPVAYASKKLTDRERKYAVEEREALALIWGIQKFHRYIYGREFTMETDHLGLQYLKTGNIRNARVMRWSLALQDYKFKVKYIKGSENSMADYLSRGQDNCLNN